MKETSLIIGEGVNYAKTGIKRKTGYLKMNQFWSLISQPTLKFRLTQGLNLSQNKGSGGEEIRTCHFFHMVRLNSTKMQMAHELRYMLNQSLSKSQMGSGFFFSGTKQHDSKIHLENEQEQPIFCVKQGNCGRFVPPDNQMLHFTYGYVIF